VTEETNFIIFHSKNISITSKTINEKLKVQRWLSFLKFNDLRILCCVLYAGPQSIIWIKCQCSLYLVHCTIRMAIFVTALWRHLFELNYLCRLLKYPEQEQRYLYSDYIIYIGPLGSLIWTKLPVHRLLEYPEQEQLYLETDQPMKPGKTYSIRLVLFSFC
jgi:hypothetical protein